MSKLIDTVKAELTGRRFPDSQGFPSTAIDVKEKFKELSYNIEYEYEVMVDLHARTRANFGDSVKAKKRACEYLAHHIFGEFREHIVEIRHAIYDGDIKGALKWLDDMQKRMFDV